MWFSLLSINMNTTSNGIENRIVSPSLGEIIVVICSQSYTTQYARPCRFGRGSNRLLMLGIN